MTAKPPNPTGEVLTLKDKTSKALLEKSLIIDHKSHRYIFLTGKVKFKSPSSDRNEIACFNRR